MLNEDSVDKCFFRVESKLQQLAMMIGKNLKQFVAFDLDREPMRIKRDRITEFHKKIAAESGVTNFTSNLEKKKEDRVKPMYYDERFNYYAICHT